MQEPKARKDMDPRYLWDLSSIIESAAEFERQFKRRRRRCLPSPLGRAMWGRTRARPSARRWR